MNSSFVSSKLIRYLNIIASKGRSHLLLRTPKQKSGKKKNVILYKDEDSKSEEEKDDIEALKDEISALTEKLREREAKSNENDKYEDLLADLFQKGVIDEDGNFIKDQAEY